MIGGSAEAQAWRNAAETFRPGVRATKRESRDEDAASASKRERKEEEEQKEKEETKCSSVPRLCINPMIDRTIVYSR